MAKCVLTCVYATAILLSISAHGSEEINEVEVNSVAVRGSIYDSPYILSANNLSFLPFFISGRKSISFCIEVAEDYSAYSQRLQSIGFSFSATIDLDYLSNELIPWDCNTEKDLTYLEENADVLTENFEVKLFIWDTNYKEIYHYKTNAKEAPANNASSMNTTLTLRLAQPLAIEGFRVLLKWNLFFTKIVIRGPHNVCIFQPNSYVWKWNDQLWAPTIDLECQHISINDGNLHLDFTPRTPIRHFPLDRIELKLDNDSVIVISMEKIHITYKEKPQNLYYSCKDFLDAGGLFKTATKNINLLLILSRGSRIKGIRVKFQKNPGSFEIKIYYGMQAVSHREDYNSWAYLAFDLWFDGAIEIVDEHLRLDLKTYTATQKFLLDSIELHLENHFQTKEVKKEETYISLEEEDSLYISFKDFVQKGQIFATAKSAIGLRVNYQGYSPVKGIKMTFVNTFDMSLGRERLSMKEAHAPKEGESSRVIYSLPLPHKECSEINVSISQSHWSIQHITAIERLKDLSGNKFPPNTSVTQGENVEGIHGFQPTISTEESTQEAVTSKSFRAEKDIGIACGVIILLIAVIAVVIKKCRCKNHSMGSSDTQTAENRRVDTVDAGTKEACVEKALERDVSHEIVELEEKGFDKSTNNEAILEKLASANAMAQSEFTLDATTSRETIPLDHENSFEEDNIIYGEF
ncbi:uncharacterized protein LOC124163622 [Ischnura elegans]|uniref:uncharacterized protein LOC124163622 n=1 Tax=Ischnura elegans TaxID=197161 RepID=UPI001ED8BC27|nr:uncharacterized protein LOC124163622 [Ischnura elegans]